MGLRPVRSALTDREWEVLDLLSGGASNEDISRLLVLSPETVRSHLKNLYRKLEVRSRGDAVAAATRMRELTGVPA
jgi:NarL family two-component system response regulator LiaR